MRHSELPPEPLAEGRVALVYAWGDGKILKLARDGVPPAWVQEEFRIAGIVHAAGVPAPKPYERVEVEGRAGIVYEQVRGPTMLDQVGKSPHLAFRLGRTLGRMHAAMHAHAGADDLPDILDRLQQKIKSVEGAPEPYRELALRRLGSLPAGASLLHGDFHPGNVVVGENGPVTIDWPDAARGHPLADVARTVILASLGGLPGHPVLRTLVRGLRAAFRSAYLGAYFRASPLRRRDLQPWVYPVLFARLSEGIQSELAMSIRWLRSLAGSELQV